MSRCRVLVSVLTILLLPGPGRGTEGTVDASALSQRAIQTDGLKFLLDLNSGFIRDVTTPCPALRSNGAGGVYFVDGHTGELHIPRKITVLTGGDRQLTYRIQNGLRDLDIVARVAWDREAIRWTVDVENRGKQDRFIEVRLGIPVACERPMQYWDGYDGMYYGYADKQGKTIRRRVRSARADANMVGHAANPSCRRDGAQEPRISMPNLEPSFAFVFPLNLLMDSRYGLAVGADPRYLMSYYTGGVQPKFTSHESFYYALKYVVLPGEKETQGFVVYTIDPDGFGYRPALDRYYREFSEQFKRRPGVNPRTLKLGCGMFPTQLAGANELWQEYARRLHLGYVWYYVGHLTTGEFWPTSGDPVEVAAARRRNQRGTRMVQRGCMVGYYCIPHRCEIEMARKRFPDAIKIDHHGKPHIKGQVKANEKLCTMYPWANSYGEHLKKDLWSVVSEGGVEALAFDNGFAADRHFGPGARESQGAAFVTGQVLEGATFDPVTAAVRAPMAYAPSYIGYAYLMDNLRARARTEGRDLAIAANNAWVLATATRADAGYLEWHWYGFIRRLGSFQHYRYLMGGKRPISYKIGGARAVRGRNPEALNLERHKRKFGLLHLFRYGGYPTMRAGTGAGDPDLLLAIPTLEKLCKAGWEPVSAARHDEALWVERFGREGDVYLSAINHTSVDYEGVIRVVNQYLGDGYRWFATEFGDQEKTLCTSHNGLTEIPARIPRTWANVYASRVTLRPGNRDVSLTGFVEADREQLRVHVTASATTPLTVVGHLPEGAYDPTARCNGQPVPVRQDGDTVLCGPVPLGDGRQVALCIGYKQRVHIVNPDEVLDFPFLREAAPACEIVFQAGYRTAAESLRRYFTYWRLQGAFGDWFQRKRKATIPDAGSVQAIPVAGVPPDNLVNVVVMGSPVFIAGAAGRALGRNVTVPVIPKGKVQVELLVQGDRKALCIAFASVDSGTGMDRLLDFLDEKYPTQPGYYPAHGKRFTRGDAGLIRHAVNGQPVYGWHELLRHLAAKHPEQRAAWRERVKQRRKQVQDK